MLSPSPGRVPLIADLRHPGGVPTSVGVPRAVVPLTFTARAVGPSLHSCAPYPPHARGACTLQYNRPEVLEAHFTDCNPGSSTTLQEEREADEDAKDGDHSPETESKQYNTGTKIQSKTNRGNETRWLPDERSEIPEKQNTDNRIWRAEKFPPGFPEDTAEARDRTSRDQMSEPERRPGAVTGDSPHPRARAEGDSPHPRARAEVRTAQALQAGLVLGTLDTESFLLGEELQDDEAEALETIWVRTSCSSEKLVQTKIPFRHESLENEKLKITSFSSGGK